MDWVLAVLHLVDVEREKRLLVRCWLKLPVVVLAVVEVRASL